MKIDWRAISVDELLRCGLLLPRAGQRAPRRILRLPHPDRAPPPPRLLMWSGQAGREFVVPIFSARAKLLGYCRRGDGWTGDPRIVFG